MEAAARLDLAERQQVADFRRELVPPLMGEIVAIRAQARAAFAGAEARDRIREFGAMRICRIVPVRMI